MSVADGTVLCLTMIAALQAQVLYLLQHPAGGLQRLRRSRRVKGETIPQNSQGDAGGKSPQLQRRGSKDRGAPEGGAEEPSREGHNGP